MAKTVFGVEREAIEELLARYCWAFDAGDGDAYAALWSDDGVLTGFGDPIRGHDALKAMLAGSQQQLGNRIRHLLHNLVMERDPDTGRVTARGYNLVLNWLEVPTLFGMIHQTFVVEGGGEDWKIAAVNLDFQN